MDRMSLLLCTKQMGAGQNCNIYLPLVANVYHFFCLHCFVHDCRSVSVLLVQELTDRQQLAAYKWALTQANKHQANKVGCFSSLSFFCLVSFGFHSYIVVSQFICRILLMFYVYCYVSLTSVYYKSINKKKSCFQGLKSVFRVCVCI